MSKKIVLLKLKNMLQILSITIILVAIVFISGCVTNNNKQNNTNMSDIITSDMIPTTNLPSGFTFVTTHETYVDIGNSSEEVDEGIYKTDQNEDVYIQVFENTSPEGLLNEYKSQYNNMSYVPFKEISFNGHNATEVTFYSTSNGKPVPKYEIIWINKNIMIKVGPSIDAQKVRNLAYATNN